MISVGKPKSHSTEWLFFIFLACLLSGCSHGVDPVQLSGGSMGTTWHVTYIASEELMTPEQVHAGIQDQLDRVERSMSTYRADSEISQINTAQVGDWSDLSNDFFSVLAAALKVGEGSQGAYDVTVGPLVDLWGFGPEDAAELPPPQASIDALRSGLGHHQLQLDEVARRLRKQADVALDFSSLAKGYGVDQVAQWLQDQGIARFLVEVGGEMRMSGLSHRGDPWHVAIELPDSSVRQVAAALSITDNAVATSGNYRNFFELDERRYSHTIDPRTGWPVAHDLVSVTVVHPSAMLADAWATALTVLGAEDAVEVAEQQGLAVYFIQRQGESFEHSHSEEFLPFLVVKD